MTGYLCRNTRVARFFVGKEMHMNYEKLSGSIRAVIDRRPRDNGAYSDLFSLCREWETEDFSAAHKVNKELLTFSARQVVHTNANTKMVKPKNKPRFLPIVYHSVDARQSGLPDWISPFGDKPRIRGAQQKNLPHGRFFRGTPERIRTAGLQSRSLSLYPAELRAHIQQELL